MTILAQGSLNYAYHKPPLLEDTFMVSFVLPLDSEILSKCTRSIRRLITLVIAEVVVDLSVPHTGPSSILYGDKFSSRVGTA